MTRKPIGQKPRDPDPTIDRIFTGLEKITGDIRETLTNPFGLGPFMKKIADKDDPLKYLPALSLVWALVTYFVGKDLGALGILVMMTQLSVIIIILLTFRYLEILSRRRKK